MKTSGHQSKSTMPKSMKFLHVMLKPRIEGKVVITLIALSRSNTQITSHQRSHLNKHIHQQPPSSPSASVRHHHHEYIAHDRKPSAISRSITSRHGIYGSLRHYESLEWILPHIPVRDSLSSQRVTKGWRDLVQRSRGIRRVLFLDDFCGDGANLHASLAHFKSIWHVDAAMSGNFAKVVHPLVNPLLNECFSDEPGRMSLLHHGLVCAVNGDNPKFRLLNPQFGALHTREASWEKMHMFQPRLNDLQLLCSEA